MDMSCNLIQLHIHLVWSTIDRLPMIDADAHDRIYKSILSEAGRLSTKVLAIGGASDHIHLLTSLRPTVAVSDLVKQLKGVSSNASGPTFRWQSGYAAISVSRRDLPQVIAYIQNQEAHHRTERLIPSLERTA
jgi:REP element-mobilizing transposase RayT